MYTVEAMTQHVPTLIITPTMMTAFMLIPVMQKHYNKHRQVNPVALNFKPPKPYLQPKST